MPRKTTVLVCAAFAAMLGAARAAEAPAVVEREVLSLERKAMEGWRQGSADAMLAISDPGITYFHVMTNGRLDGTAAVEGLYAAYRGRPLFDSYEIVTPKVQASGDIAVLTYILVSHNGNASTRWNATEVYQRQAAGWKIIHSHWSQTRPAPADGAR